MATTHIPAPPTFTGDIENRVLQLAQYVIALANAIQGTPPSGPPSLAPGSPLFHATLPVTTGTPTAPTNLQGFGLYKQIILVWDHDPNQQIHSWEVQQQKDGGGYKPRSDAYTYSFLDEELDHASTYDYKVRAVALDGVTLSSFTTVTGIVPLVDDSTVLAVMATAAAAIQAAGTL